MAEQPAIIEKLNPVNAHCPTCDGERVCDVHGQAKTSWGNEHIDGGADHSLLQCRGCESVFYQKESWDSESYSDYYDDDGKYQRDYDITTLTYPSPESKTKREWLDAIGKQDGQLQKILDEMYVAYDNGAYILAAVGLRTALDRGTEVLGVDPAKTFAEKLRDLLDGGWIGATEHDILEVIADAGGAAAHRGWSPDAKELRQLLYAMEVFLQRAFLVGKDALNIKNNIPAKPKRQKANQAPAKAT